MKQDETKKSQARIKKEEKVAELKKKFADSKNLIFWDYTGLTVTQFQQLREQLTALESKVGVAKNTLIKLALENLKLKTFNLEPLVGPTAILEASNGIESLKILANFIKNSGVGKLKFGFIEGKFAKTAELEFLATLPSYEAIMGQISNLLYLPINNLLAVLQSNLRNIVFVLNQRAQS